LVKPSHVDANDDATAKFQWTTKTGEDGHATVLHKFTLIFDDGQWQICNFTIQNLSDTGGDLFSQ
jgi:hypothetical protein